MTISKQISERTNYMSLVGQTGSPTPYLMQLTEQEVYMFEPLKQTEQCFHNSHFQDINFN